jgi:hypothetical protein
MQSLMPLLQSFPQPIQPAVSMVMLQALQSAAAAHKTGTYMTTAATTTTSTKTSTAAATMASTTVETATAAAAAAQATPSPAPAASATAHLQPSIAHDQLADKDAGVKTEEEMQVFMATEDIASLDDVIRCTCGFDKDDGFTIQYEQCRVWQHAICVNVDRRKSPRNICVKNANHVGLT